MKKQTNKIEESIKNEIENELNKPTFDEALLEMEELNLTPDEQATLLELTEVIEIVSIISSVLQTHCDIMQEATIFSWYYKRGELLFDVIGRELQFVDWEADMKTTLTLEGVASRFNLQHDWYMSETERLKLEAKLKKMNKEKE